MFDFWQLVVNENMKIYRRPRTWIMMAIMLALALTVSVVTLAVADGDRPVMWEMMLMEAQLLFSLVTIYTVVVSAESVAGEFSTGTIKLLLIRPWSRAKILLSKYVSLLLFALLFAAVLLVFTLLLNLLLFGPGAGYRFPARDTLPPLAYMLLYYISQLVRLLIVVTMSFMISTVFRSGGLAIGLSIFLLLGGSSIAGILSLLGYEWVKYLPFLHLDLTPYLNKAEVAEGVTFGFSVAVLAAYYIVFVALAWLVFRKRDVAA